MTQSPKAGYRPDIDGLRAVAVLLVVLDHLRTRATGGYIGVDVFFVISGYLITGHILSDVRKGRFTLTDFYERRVRRILPALIVMLVAVTVAAWFLLLPTELFNFGRSVVATLLSASNFVFLHQAGYFDAQSAVNPLLHTWSLAVEEQFYLVLPLLILLMWRWLPNHLRLVFWIGTIASFIAACLWVSRSPSTAFFSSPLRAWELFIGALLSQGWLMPELRQRVWREIVALVGLLLIVVPAFLYTEHTTFPGFSAFPPCFGAALLIAAGSHGDSLTGRMLSLRPVVFIGTISYSLYLWHWPLIVLTSYARIQPGAAAVSSPKMKAILFGVSLLIASLSYWFVETPFRKGRFRPARKPLFVMAGVTAAAVLAVGGSLMASGGAPQRLSPQAAQTASYLNYHTETEWRQSLCFITPDDNFSAFSVSQCLQQHGAAPHVLLLGDSMAAQLYPGLRQQFPAWDLAQANSADCRPFVEQTGHMQQGYAANCRSLTRLVYSQALPHTSYDLVLLAASWQSDDMDELGRTIAWLQQHGMKVVLFGNLPEYDTDLPRLLALSQRLNKPGLVNQHRTAHASTMDRTMKRLAPAWNVQYISALDTLCHGDVEAACPLYASPGVPLQFDNHHLTIPGSILYAHLLQQQHQLP
ncbi:MAG: acyltransferase family protein [Terriglobus sp.]